ncbi:uncharacterized protein CXQ87_002385 [Candidozyma duobushaemuli]|uniref:Cytochrome b5 heme-binding domain-containing protein n=1 Tax=Candidozyma duobushaemuli TaxID=1231522 RepID=A0A2V1A744_9ASCO|nr:uncharacterized protein CXQ87_002385 [[Candida] duobushaemulonis]PVH14257.1 hypothetical protein CXQ87_002385 [[Candida] duobushaemulonis]
MLGVDVDTFETKNVDRLAGTEVGLILADEGHRLKNGDSLTFNALNSLRCERRVILSGTPIQNDLSEYYSLLNFANPGYLGTRNEFRKNFENAILRGRDADATDSEREKGDSKLLELSQLVSKFIIRRTNDILSKYLPVKYEYVVYLATLKAIDLLKKLCTHPDLLRLPEDIRGSRGILPEDYTDSSSSREKSIPISLSTKFSILERFIESLRHESDDKIVIISNYTKTLDLIERLCRHRRYGCLRLDGTMNINKRQKIVDRFNDPKGPEFIFLLSSKAGGCGINLIGANRLILMDPDWNPAADQQALARVWRDGQKKDCFIYRFICTGTIEEKIYQLSSSIKDSVEQFYNDTLKTAKDRANPSLIKVLTYHSADAVHWLQEIFELDLSIVSRLGGHSQPRTHRGKDAKFPGMAITYKLLETLENLAEEFPDRVAIMKNTQVIDLLIDENDSSQVLGVKYKDLKTKGKDTLRGPVILATGGYAADFTKNSLLRKYRPDIIDLPSTNGTHATGDGQKIVMKHSGIGIDMDKVQVHPTGLIDFNDADVIEGRKQPRHLFLGAEALRGEGGIILNNKGERFCDELGTRDYVSGEMEKQIKQGNGPLRLVLSDESEERLAFHIKHYEQRSLMRTISGKDLAQEMKIPITKLQETLDLYNRAAKHEIDEPFGKKYFPTTPFTISEDRKYHVSFITRVLHFTMGGIKINDRTQVIYNGNQEEPFQGLYAAGEVAGGVHGHNRLGGSSLLACVVYGRLAAHQASSFLMRNLSMAQPLNENQSASARLNQISLHIDPNRKQITIDLGGEAEGNKPARPATIEESSEAGISGKSTSAKGKQKTPRFEIPEKEFTADEVAKHNSESDCWVIVKNVVLDLTSFLDDHPGGRESILNFAGKDATESFDMLHEDNVIQRYAPKCVLGRLKGATPFLELKE